MSRITGSTERRVTPGAGARRTTRALVVGMLVALGCTRAPLTRIDLSPRGTQPLYRIQTADAEELAILREQLGVEVVHADGRSAVLRLTDAGVEKLRRAGYDPAPVDPRTVEFRVVRVAGMDAAALAASGVQLLNRERRGWIVRGSLQQLELLQRAGYRLSRLDREVRPREVRIDVPTRDDVQRVYDLGVDIFTVRPAREGGGMIEGAAYDGQIDELRRRGYGVVVVSEP